MSKFMLVRRLLRKDAVPIVKVVL